jgi:elongation factor Ts
MAQITASLVKELRDKTGAGMMDCKKALTETDGDMEGAVDWLRTKGLAAAQKKSGRVAAEGLVAVVTDGGRGAVVEVNSETDFVARNEQFQAFAAAVAGIANDKDGDLDAVMAASFPETGRSVQDELTHLIATIGENMTVRRMAALRVDPGVIGAYTHAGAAAGIGRIGVLVALESSGDAGKLAELGKQVAMHIAAAAPQSVDVSSLDPAAIERERAVLAEQARESGKPENIIAKMVEGRLRKFYEDVVLTEQVWVHDPDQRVGKVLEQAGKDLGAPVKVVGFVRYALGEGVEREEKDFAAEVAAQAGV